MMQEPDRFIGVLKHRVAPILYSVVTASFCLGSLMTTTQGFRSIFNFWFSLCLALGLQSAMLGASIFFAHNEAPQRRLPWLGVGMFAAILSISFSYVGLRFDFEKVVLHIERPIRNRSDFLIQRDHLQEVAAQERGAALRSLDDQIAESDSRRGSADLSRVGRQIRAAEYRQEMSALIERIDHPPAAQSSTEATRLQQRLQTIKAQLAIVDGNSEILTLESLRQRSSLQQLRKLRKEVDDYAPDFQDVKDSDAAGKPDWSGLARQYDRLTRLMHEVPGESFQAALSSALPGPPAVKILSTDGQVMEGEGHPILSAFQHLARLEPLDLFFLALAASFDLIPLIFNWALGNQRSKGVSIPESLSAIGAWQRRTRGALQSMDGIVPFSTRAFWSVLFGRATRTGHAAVTEFEERLVLEQLEMDAKLKQLVMPDSLRQLIALEFAHLGTRVTAQREDLEKKSDPNFVAAKDWNPFSQQARMRRSAEKAAYEGKLEIFRDQIQAVRKSNEVLNRGAIAQVAIAAETFLTGLIADAERLKHKVRQSALEGRTDDLEQELISLDERLKRGVVPADMIEALQNNALNVFAADAAKIAAVDVVFKKDRLLSIEFSSARQEE